MSPSVESIKGAIFDSRTCGRGGFRKLGVHFGGAPIISSVEASAWILEFCLV